MSSARPPAQLPPIRFVTEYNNPGEQEGARAPVLIAANAISPRGGASVPFTRRKNNGSGAATVREWWVAPGRGNSDEPDSSTPLMAGPRRRRRSVSPAVRPWRRGGRAAIRRGAAAAAAAQPDPLPLPADRRRRQPPRAAFPGGRDDGRPRPRSDFDAGLLRRRHEPIAGRRRRGADAGLRGLAGGLAEVGRRTPSQRRVAGIVGGGSGRIGQPARRSARSRSP